MMTARGNPVLTLWQQLAVTAAIASLFAAGQARANGTNPTVVAGQASFSTLGSSLSISNSPGTIINWQGFSIGAGETTRFIQQSAASSVLNRVIGPDPSSILGTLTSNGRVFLVNPSGILVGHGAHIDVAGLVASTLNLNNQDFLEGRLNFSANSLAGKVENQGSITTPSGGSVYLVGSNVTNSGIINSPQGDVILAAGQSVKIFDSSTPGVRVEVTASDNSVVNLGEILAQSGEVGIYGAVLRNAGIIDADQVVRNINGKIVLRAKQDVTLDAGSRLNANGEQGGEITVQSETGTTQVSGTIEAKGTGAGQTGGTVQVLGDKVGLFGANINISGDGGGGTVLIGGDYQGSNPSVQNALATYVSPDTSIQADSITSGNGGKVIVWADDFTRFGGNISARGGANSGDGGFVEVSGKHYLDFLGVVNTLAPAGKAGTLLLDPSDITISADGDAGMSGIASPFSGTTDTSTLNVTTLTNALGGGNVLVDASAGAAAGAGNITVSTAVTWVAATTLELKAKNDVIVNAAMTDNTAGAAIKLTAGHDVTVNQPLSANGAPAAITLSAGHDVLVNAALSANGAGSVIELRADNLGTGTGTVTFSGAGSVSGTTPTTNIYYNPISYDNYAADLAAYLSFVPSGLNTYMLLFVTGLSADKTYDGNLTASLTGTATIAPAVADDVNLAGTGSVTNFSNQDVHTEILTLSGYSINGTEAYKYSLFQPSSLSAAITAKTVTLSASKTYTGTTDLTGAVTLATGISGEALTYTGAFANDAHVAAANKYIGAITLADGTGLASNYALPTLNVANAPVTISTASLTPTLTNAGVTKTYDGTTDVPAGFSQTYSFTGLVSGDTDATLTSTTSAYNDKDVADANKVTVSGLSITGITGGNSSAATDYALDAASKDVLAAITAKTVTLSASKTYTGTTDLTGAVTLATGISGEALTYTGAFANDAHVAAANKYVNAITLADGTGLASNYQLPTLNVANAPVTINTATLTPTLTNAGVTKTYDGTTDVPTGFSPTYSFIGLVSGDTDATLTSTASAYNDKDVSDANKVTVSGLSITGITGGNSSAATDYALDAASKDVLAAITAKTVTLSASKTYTGTTDLTGAVNLATGISGETLTYTGATANDAHVATANKYVNAITLTDNGAVLASNYQLPTLDVANAPVTISTATLTPTLTNVGVTKTYDGTTDVPTGFSPTYSFIGLVSGDTDATLTSTASAYNDKDVSDANKVTVSGLSITGITGGNSSAATDYALDAVSKDVLAAITPAPLSITANSTSKTYGSTVSFTGSEFSSIGLMNSETVGSVSLASAGAAATAGVAGSPYAITPSAAAGNFNAGNYTISYVHGTLGVIPVLLMVTADAQSKVYGTSDPALTFGTTGLVYNPALGVTDTAATVLLGALTRASGETVPGGPYAITQGTLVTNSNYTLNSFTGNTLTITPAPLNVAANPQSKIFGASDPALTFSVTGLVSNPALGIGDTIDSELSGALTRVPGESALGGPYAITQGSLAVNSSNYLLGFTPNNLIIIGAAAEPVLGFNPVQVVFAGVINNEFYYRPGNFWHISLNPNNADPGFDVMRGTNDFNARLNRFESDFGGDFFETWSFPQQFENVDEK